MPQTHLACNGLPGSTMAGSPVNQDFVTTACWLVIRELLQCGPHAKKVAVTQMQAVLLQALDSADFRLLPNMQCQAEIVTLH